MPRPPLSYDEIVRHTVIDPVGTWRAEPPLSEEELRLDRQMRAAIGDALVSAGISTLGFEVMRGRVILHGWVKDPDSASQVEGVIRRAAPDAVIDNRMRVGR